MKFLLDANVRITVGRSLQTLGHDVRFLAGTPEYQISDREVIELAWRERRILITNDKDFGHLIFRQRLRHQGVVLFRLNDESRNSHIDRIKSVIDMYGNRLENHYLVVTDDHVRYR